MHPLISAWLAYATHLNRQPPQSHPGDAWSAWLDEAARLERWYYILRKLPESANWHIFHFEGLYYV